MPPKNLARCPNSENTSMMPAIGDEILALFDLTDAGLAIVANGFDLQEEFEILIHAMRDPDPNVKLRGQAQYRRTIMDMIKMNGLLSTSTMSESYERDGSQVTRTATTTHMLANLRGRNEDERKDAPYDEESFVPKEQ